MARKRKTFIMCDLDYWQCLYQCSIEYGHGEEKKKCEEQCSRHCQELEYYD